MELIMTDEKQQEVEQPTEKQLSFDPKAIEADMIKAAEARAEDPGEMAASMYAMYVPHFKRALSKLSTRGLRRVLQNAVLYPLEQDDLRTSSDFEKEVTLLINSLLECKFVMIMDTYN